MQKLKELKKLLEECLKELESAEYKSTYLKTEINSLLVKKTTLEADIAKDMSFNKNKLDTQLRNAQENEEKSVKLLQEVSKKLEDAESLKRISQITKNEADSLMDKAKKMFAEVQAKQEELNKKVKQVELAMK